MSLALYQHIVNILAFNGFICYFLFRLKKEAKLVSDNKENFVDTAEDLDEMFVTLTFDDGQEEECEVITIFEANGGKDYIALIPVSNADDDESDIYFYRYKEDANGEPELENIEDDDEYELAADAFDELLDEEEFEEADK